MSNWYQILSRFLERHGDHVQGRSLEPLSPKLKGELRRFVKGELSPPAQEKLLQTLDGNPEAVKFLADELQKLSPKRPAAASGAKRRS